VAAEPQTLGAAFITSAKLPVRIVQIDVPAHRKRYRFPQPEFQRWP